jgi:chloride channel protein, CIC family
LGIAAIHFPQLLGNGKDIAQLAFTGSVPLFLALSLAAMKPIATAACLGSGAPGGLFTPTLTLGALLGAAGGMFESGAYALVGAGAVLAASTQGPVSAVVLLLELTRRLDTTMVPVMLAVIGSILVACSLEARSIYSGRLHTARKAVSEGRCEAISAAARTPELLRKLVGGPHRKLNVVDQDGQSLGSLAGDRVAMYLDADHPIEIVTARDLLQTAERPQARCSTEREG